MIVEPSASTSVPSIPSVGAIDRYQAKQWDRPIPYSDLTIGVLKETFKGENRVSQTPDSVRTLTKAGFKVIVESKGKCTFDFAS